MAVKPLTGISLGYFMVLLDMTVLSVAEPDLARSLHGSVVGLQWVVTAYTVAFAALLLSAGAVADRFGAHRVFRAGVAGFGAVSLGCALAPGLWALVGLRALLGVAAAAVAPASIAMIARNYPDPAARARAVAVWAAVSGAALPAGPVVGGLLVEAAGWRAVFLVNVPLAAVVLALVAGRTVGSPRGSGKTPVVTHLSAAIALALLTDALIALGSASYPHAALAAAGAVVAGLPFVVRRSTVLVPTTPVLRAALVAGGAVNFTMSGVLFVLPLLLQHRLGPVATGLAFLPMTIPFAVNPLLTGRIVARVGPRAPVIAGLALLAASGAVLAWAVAAGAAYPVLAVGLVGTGFGVSLALPALVTLVVATAAPGTAGAAGGLLNAVRQVGATVGVAATGGFGAGRGSSALLLCALVCAGAAALTVLTGDRHRTGSRR